MTAHVTLKINALTKTVAITLDGVTRRFRRVSDAFPRQPDVWVGVDLEAEAEAERCASNLMTVRALPCERE